MALVVTSPLTVSPEAKDAQRHLKNNAFDDFLEGPVDNVWGPECRRATLRAKRALGYSRRSIQPGYGSALDAYLSGSRPLTAAMKERRRDFLQDQRQAVRARALKFAKDELGVEERPAGSNDVKFARWYMGAKSPTGWTAERPGPPWCMIFCSWAYSQAFEAVGLNGFPRIGSRYAFCPFVVTAAVEGNFGLDQVRNPKPGDLVLYQFDADANADHVGLFEKWVSEDAGTFTAIEGNTSSSSDANGGRVERRTRNRSQVYRPRTGGLAFARVSPID